MSIVLFMSLFCPDTKLINVSNRAINGHDLKTMHRTKGRCKVHFPDAPCLIKFIKRDTKTYWAICGEKRLK